MKNKNAISKITAIFSAAVIVLSLFFSVTVLSLTSSAATVNTAPRVVSIVYDDSGSMKNNDKYAYANYAFQMFVGLLGDDDHLFVTYMSGDTQTVNLSSRQATIDAFKGKQSNYDTTNYYAVTNAFNKLSSVKADEKSEYWLVVITDGIFAEFAGDEENPMSKNESQELLKSSLQELYNTPMPNGTKAKVEYMAITDGTGNTIELQDMPEYNIKAYTANGAAIVSTFSKIAEEITGKSRLNSSDISFPAKDTVSVASALPLKNIVSVVQGSTAKLLSVSGSKGTQYNISRNINIAAPSGSSGASGLFGIVGVCEQSSVVLPADTYTLKFDNDVASNTVDVLFEPALEAKVVMYGDADGDGKEEILEEPYNITNGMKIRVKSEIIDPTTGEPIDDAILKKYNINIEVEYKEDGNVIGNYTGDDVKLTVGEDCTEGNISTVISIGDFEPINDEVGFSIAPIPVFGVQFISDSGKYVYVIPSTFFKSLNKEIDNSGFLTFAVTKDDVPAAADDINASGYKVTGISASNHSAEVLDGEIRITPKDYSAWDYFFSGGIFRGLHSEKKITVEVNNASDTGVFGIDASNIIWDLLLILLIVLTVLLIILYIIAWFFTAGRFPAMKVTKYTWPLIVRDNMGIQMKEVAHNKAENAASVTISPLAGDYSAESMLELIKHGCERKANILGITFRTKANGVHKLKVRYKVSVDLKNGMTVRDNYYNPKDIDAVSSAFVEITDAMNMADSGDSGSVNAVSTGVIRPGSTIWQINDNSIAIYSFEKK